jgi:site-specific recombinase XerD
MNVPTLKFYPNIEKRSTKDNSIPVYARIIFNERKAEAKLPISIQNEEELKYWNKELMRLEKGISRADVNEQIDSYQFNFRQLIKDNLHNLYYFNSKTILNNLCGKKEQETEVLLSVFLNKFLHQTVLCDTNISKGTKKNYKKSINHLMKFLTTSKFVDIKLKDFDNKLAHHFMDYLKGNANDKFALKDTSASGIIKIIKRIFERAIDENVIVHNPFKKVKLSHRYAQKPRLYIGHIKSLVEMDLANAPNLELYRDIFLFYVYTGLAYNDVIQLKRNQNIIKIGAEEKLVINRLKTGVITEQFLVTQARAIIEKYKADIRILTSDSILPKRSNKEINQMLKIIAERAGISINLSCHIGRHSFRQLLGEAEIEEQVIIKRMMGHSSSKDIDSVYYAVTDRKLLVAKEKLQKYLNENL